MFRVAFFVDDKHLADTMHALAGRARDLQVVPVINAKGAPGGKVTQKGADSLALIMDELRKLKVENLGAKELRAAVQKVGFSPTSYNHYAQNLVKSGDLRKHGKGAGMSYTVAK